MCMKRCVHTASHVLCQAAITTWRPLRQTFRSGRLSRSVRFECCKRQRLIQNLPNCSGRAAIDAARPEGITIPTHGFNLSEQLPYPSYRLSCQVVTLYVKPCAEQLMCRAIEAKPPRPINSIVRIDCLEPARRSQRTGGYAQTYVVMPFPLGPKARSPTGRQSAKFADRRLRRLANRLSQHSRATFRFASKPRSDRAWKAYTRTLQAHLAQSKGGRPP
jgi:hypothetical protein